MHAQERLVNTLSTSVSNLSTSVQLSLTFMQDSMKDVKDKAKEDKAVTMELVKDVGEMKAKFDKSIDNVMNSVAEVRNLSSCPLPSLPPCTHNPPRATNGHGYRAHTY